MIEKKKKLLWKKAFLQKMSATFVSKGNYLHIGKG